jgi:hypothetical protein
VFLYAGDFHIMKKYMVVIWDVLNGSGVEDVLGCIYKAAAHRSILNVHNVNYSLRCCKLVYTALSVLFFEAFIKASTSSTPSLPTTGFVETLKGILKSIPSDYTIATMKQQWFSTMIEELDKLKLSDALDKWAVEQCRINPAFSFWFFIYRKLLELLILMYMSIRLSNFDGLSLVSLSSVFAFIVFAC